MPITKLLDIPGVKGNMAIDTTPHKNIFYLDNGSTATIKALQELQRDKTISFRHTGSTFLCF